MQGKVARVSAYEPMGLFSGDPKRMQGALLALLADPQNNLRLFRDGLPLPFRCAISIASHVGQCLEQ